MINCPFESVILNYGNSWGDLSNSITMTLNSSGEYEGEIPSQPYNSMFCYSITATICEEVSYTFFGSENIPPFPFEGIITTISEIQGESEESEGNKRRQPWKEENFEEEEKDNEEK